MDYNSYTFKNKVIDKLNDDDKKKKSVSKLKKITKNNNTITTETRHPNGMVTKSVLTKKVKSVPNKYK